MTLIRSIAPLLLGLCVAGPNWATTSQDQELTLDDIRAFSEAFSRIKQDYVEEISDRDLMEKAIRGMLRGLDDYSRYLSRESFESLENTTGGRVGDIGVKLRSRNGKLIIALAEDPSGAAGVVEGDEVRSINDIPVSDISLARAHQMMSGLVGQEVRLSVRRPKISIDLKFEIARELRAISGVNHDLLGPDIGYVQISTFQTNTLEHVAAALADLERRQPALKGLVLDVRGNPGGILSSAVAVADLFLTEGTIVYTRGRASESQIHHMAGRDERFAETPVALLVDRVTASAAEILVGALQDHGRGKVVGDQTFGKGSVQTIMPLVNGSAVKLTTAHYFTPNGRSIQTTGITPDVAIRLADNETEPGDAHMDTRGPGLPGDRALSLAIKVLHGEHAVGQADAGPE